MPDDNRIKKTAGAARVTPAVAPVKTAAADGSWTVEYKNIDRGSQADSLFEVPAGFQKTAMPGMGAGGMGGMPQGMRPGQGMPPAQGN